MHAQLDNASQAALTQTQQLMNSPEERQKYINDHPNAQKVDQNVSRLTGTPENQQAIYKLASQILATQASQANGDITQMKLNNAEAEKNPEAFFNSLSPEQQKAIRDLASQISSGSGATASPH